MADLKALQEKVAASASDLKYIKTDEKTLCRYLTAHKTVDAAYKKIVATNEWRLENEVWKVTKETPGVQRAMKTRVAKVLDGVYDTSHRPVGVVAVRNHSILNRNIDDLTQFIIYNMETMVSKFVEDGPETFCMVFDMKDFSMLCMDYPVVRRLLYILMDHYPERLGLCIILNAPILFTACWAIIRSWLDEHMVSKFKFIKTEELSTYMDPSLLPEL